MTVTLNLAPQVEQAYLAEARARGYGRQAMPTLPWSCQMKPWSGNPSMPTVVFSGNACNRLTSASLHRTYRPAILKYTSKIETAAGVTPGILAACPNVAGCTRSNLSSTSRDSPGTNL
jgi:hypothetical protein